MHVPRTHCFGATYPKNEMKASVIQHAIPTYGIANIALSSPERNTEAVQSRISGAAEATRKRRTVGNIEGISDAENASGNNSQDRDDNSRLNFSGNP
jgi:hypothetical protein